MAAENEKRLIYANEALRMMKHCKADNPYFNGKTTPVWEMAHDCAMSCIEACSTVDAVEVVRCKDCKHYIKLLESDNHCRCSIFCGCYDRPYPTEPQDFCSYGERREGE